MSWTRALALALLLAFFRAQPSAAEEMRVPPGMTTYYVVFLVKGPKWTAEVTPALQKLQIEHLKHIRKKVESGKALIVGPFLDGGRIAGMTVFQGTVEEVKALAEADPMVLAGHLAIELHPWMAAKGIRADPVEVPVPKE